MVMYMLKDSGIFNMMGLGNLDIAYVIIGLLVFILLLLIFLILQSVQVKKLRGRLDRFVMGKEGSSLEQDIAALYEDNKLLKTGMDKNKKDIRTLYKKLEPAYQKMGLVKYDAFSHMGGQLSFSLCLLDENNNGFVINSVHSTEGCYSYTKEIKAGESSILLGQEETEALAIAKGEA